MLIPAILVSIVALLAAMDEQLFGASMMARPLFTGPIIGLIMGDLQTGVIIGATLESMFMGSIMVGSAVPPEVYASSILSIAIAIQTGAGAGTAVALALPLSGSWAGKQIEKALDERNLKKANLLHLTVVPLSIGILSALLVFIALFFGADGINSVLNMIPEVVLNGFNVAAGVLSCVGLALLIKIMSNNKILPYLFLGFVAVMYLGMDVIGVAVVGLCIAFLAVNNMQFEEEDDF